MHIHLLFLFASYNITFLTSHALSQSQWHKKEKEISAWVLKSTHSHINFDSGGGGREHKTALFFTRAYRVRCFKRIERKILVWSGVQCAILASNLRGDDKFKCVFCTALEVHSPCDLWAGDRTKGQRATMRDH